MSTIDLQAGTVNRSATLQSVAEAAGVHRSTVARALDPSQSHRISAEVVERVRAEAQRQGYRRDAIAASLRTGKSRLVGVVIPDLANPAFAAMLASIEDRLASAGYSMLVADGGGRGGPLPIVEELMARRVDGLVLATAMRDDAVLSACIDANVPTVLVNRREDALRVTSVAASDIGGMCLAVDHLVSLGHRRIGHLAGPVDMSTGNLRAQGFAQAMRRSDLDPSPVVASREYSRDAGRAAMQQLLDRWPQVTAIAAGNDLLALGAIQEIKLRGLSCPGDVSVVGHNDMPLLDMVAPALTTVDAGFGEMGQVAARVLLAAIEKPGGRPEEILMTPRLILRESTAAR
jgi:LacI family transcriptional regulator